MSNSAAESLAGDPVIQLVTFRLKDETYGINVMQVQEVLRVSEIAPVPGAPPFVLGIINLRGNVVTVVDTRTRFGLPTTERDDASRIVIIESEQQVVGILVDSVAEVVELRQSAIDAAPMTAAMTTVSATTPPTTSTTIAPTTTQTPASSSARGRSPRRSYNNSPPRSPRRTTASWPRPALQMMQSSV